MFKGKVANIAIEKFESGKTTFKCSEVIMLCLGFEDFKTNH